jgi:hypothetical protein
MTRQFFVNQQLINQVIIWRRHRVITVNPITKLIISRLLRKLIVSPLTLLGR